MLVICRHEWLIIATISIIRKTLALMSRFFAQEDYDAYTSTGSEESFHYTTSEPEKEEEELVVNYEYESSVEDDGKRIVKSQKEKRKDDILDAIRNMYTSVNMDDWINVQKEYDYFMKVWSKSIVLFGRVVPLFLTKALFDLQSWISDTDNLIKQGELTLDALNAKAFNVLKQKLKKTEFEKEIEKYRQNPVRVPELDSDYEDEDESDSGEDDYVEVDKVEEENEITEASIPQILNEIMSIREKIKDLARDVKEKTKIFCMLITSIFDVNLNIFIKAENYTKEFLGFLSENPDVEIEEYSLSGTMLSIVHRLDEELKKHFLSIEGLNTEYVERLKDEVCLYKIILAVQRYFREKKDVESECLVILQRLEHLYYKTANVLDHPESDDKSDIVEKLVNYILENANEKMKVKALLFYSFHLATFGFFDKAKHLFLVLNLSDSINTFDISTQVLYNRTLVKIGLLAFSLGNFNDCYVALGDLLSTSRQRELLSQYYKSDDRNSKSIPPHCQLDMELIETAYLTCAMLLEVSSDKKPSNRSIKRIMEFYEKNTLSSPPEQMRDFVIAAAIALSKGDWRKCTFYINSLPIWNCVSLNKSILNERIKVEALKCYVQRNSANYSSLSLNHLATYFALSNQEISSIITDSISSKCVNSSLAGDYINFDIGTDQASELSQVIKKIVKSI
ncbi:hypothetical protein ROZALSC1DRAFT_27911 [Rozella allomycis CSF55]|uniref:Eukaryotic translation initiation factor 3 subunit C N-terminal domain-containing protein n=1 Tax=Rozella allomycis (strain CSF55) TaxID=988480 RepID=A0A4P9YLT0_ROZAC|nr:hypothetical protein ROZALSC1DRAFT_27911 [Rozella allomycis CSF55]